ncbi:MAG: tetratricopeptide repeat protein [Bacteroidaceae bacterium]|nr:tetratricopeptide repeat protein [Bacteroidaceae bacterium]
MAQADLATPEPKVEAAVKEWGSTWQQRRLRTMALVLCILAFPLMAGAQAAQKATPASKESAEADGKFRTYYLESVVQREKGNHTGQYQLLKRALELRPEAPEALFDLAMLGTQGAVMESDEVEQLFQKAIALTQEQNLYYMECYGKYEMTLGKYEEAVPVFRKLAQNDLKREMAFQMLATIFERQQQYEDLLGVLEDWEKAEGENEEIENMKMKTLNRMRRYDDEIVIAEKLMHENPDNEYYPVARAEAYLHKGDTATAWKAYKEAVAANPDNLSAQVFRVLYFQSLNDEERLLEAIEAVIMNNSQPNDLRVSMMQSLMSSLKGSKKGEMQVERIFSNLMMQPLIEKQFPQMYAQYLASKNRPDSAFVPCMRKLLEIDPTEEQARLLMVQEALDHKDYEEAVRLCKEGIKLRPSRLIFYHIGGGALYQEKRYAESLELFQYGLEQVPATKDRERVSNFYSSYADALHQAGYRDKAYAYYDSALVYNPSNVICLNNYAYFLSLSSDRLDDARKMSARVLKIEPENPTYLDTYAWILFMQGDYEQARAYMEQAMPLLEDEPEDANLYEHAGDIYLMLGRKKEAQAAWQKARKLAPPSKTLKKKIRSSKYIKE